jgi:hypothetical protein
MPVEAHLAPSTVSCTAVSHVKMCLLLVRFMSKASRLTYHFPTTPVLCCLQVPLYDLRSPLGVAPAALTTSHHQQQAAAAPDTHASHQHSLLMKAVNALSESQLPPSLVVSRAFAANRSQLRAKVASSGQVRMCVCVTQDDVRLVVTGDAGV